VVCIPEHPFFVSNKWVEARDLKAGDSLYTFTGSYAVVDSVYSFKTDTATRVYNLDVAGNHDFYVTASRVLVHNCENSNLVIIGETMSRVEAVAAKYPGATILNDMPLFTGTDYQITSKMMAYNRQWILNHLRNGKAFMDIGRDATRVYPSIFYDMEPGW
jgi:hypothetical protein